MSASLLVLDASAAVDLVMTSPRGARVAAAVMGFDLVAPDLLDVEVVSALARLERAATLSTVEAGAALSALAALPVTRLSHQVLRASAWSMRSRLRIADAFYVATAALAASTLLTCDARLARSNPGVRVHLIT